MFVFVQISVAISSRVSSNVYTPMKNEIDGYAQHKFIARDEFPILQKKRDTFFKIPFFIKELNDYQFFQERMIINLLSSASWVCLFSCNFRIRFDLLHP